MGAISKAVWFDQFMASFPGSELERFFSERATLEPRPLLPSLASIMKKGPTMSLIDTTKTKDHDPKIKEAQKPEPKDESKKLPRGKGKPFLADNRELFTELVKTRMSDLYKATLSENIDQNDARILMIFDNSDKVTGQIEAIDACEQINQLHAYVAECIAHRVGN